ncbi:hypothetical protein D3C76_1078300 [compost metagenome]
MAFFAGTLLARSHELVNLALPSAFIFWNTGDSLSCRRMYTETISSRIDSRNGIRQPQASKASVPRIVRQARMPP